MFRSGSMGVRIAYTRNEGSFPKDKDISASLGFKLVRELPDNETKTNNILSVPNGDDAPATVTVDNRAPC